MKATLSTEPALLFKESLARYKAEIDADLENFAQNLLASTDEQFGEYSAESMRVFCDVLSRGGKRIRGALSMVAYEMFGGTNKDVAIKAARIMELLQTYLLVIDDVYDRSRTRRGLPSAHVMLSELHAARHWKDDALHFGETIAFNSGIIGNHLAMSIAADLDVEPYIALRAIKILNTNLQVTGEGQANDVFNEVVETSSMQQIENVLLWKTAYYTFVNPLQFGATLAGVDDSELDRLLEYSLAAGRTFQITDDILGTFGSEFESGKSPMDDMREGKRTLLILHTLAYAKKEDSYFLEQMLGNHELTQAQFKKCQDIIFKAGSLEFARSEASQSSQDAIRCVDEYWSSSHKDASQFLKSLVQYLLVRKS